MNDPDQARGLDSSKFLVHRTDGSSDPGGKHESCEFFVLDLHHDKYAVPALLAYANACQQSYPLLAADLRKKAIAFCEHEWVDTLHGPDTIGEHCEFCGVDRDNDYAD